MPPVRKRVSSTSPYHAVSLLLLLLVWFTSNPAYPADVTLAWDANIESDLAGYRVYHREEGQAYDYNYPVWEGTETTCSLYSLDESVVHYFVATAFDSHGNESEDSTEVSFTSPVNVSPTADAGVDQTVEEGVTVTLNGSNSTDSDGTIASYGWTQLSGTSVTLFDATSAQPVFTAPHVSSTGEALTFELTVTDDSALSDTDTVIINVSNVYQAPTADAGPDQTVEEITTVTLNGSNSTDPDGSITAYQWVQTEGTSVTLSDATSAQPSFTAPYVSSTGEALTFELTVIDNYGLSDTDTVIVNISNVNQTPTADAGMDQTVEEGVTVTLNGSNSTDSDGTIASYLWTQTQGTSVTLSDTNSPQPSFLAPYIDLTSDALSFQLTVTDDGGLSDTDTVIVNVSNANQAPRANAGPYQTVTEGSVVTLDGSASWDPDGTVVSYSWTQVDGSSVTLSETWSVQPTFIAPDVDADGGSTTFELTVTDDGGLQTADTCVIDITDRPEESGCPRIRISDIAIHIQKKGPHYQARAYVVVLDESGVEVKEASIRGNWNLNGTPTGSSLSSTNGMGEAKLDSDKIKAKTGDTFTLTVVEMVKEGCVYDPFDETSSAIVP